MEALIQQYTGASELADSFFRVGYFDTPNGMEYLLSEGGFAVCDHVATDGFGRYISAGVNAFSAEQYQVWLEYHLQTCREPSLLGSSNHGLIIGRKMEPACPK